MSPVTQLINLLKSCGLTVTNDFSRKLECHHQEVLLNTLRDAALRLIAESTGRQSATDIIDSVAAIFKVTKITPAPEFSSLQGGISYHSITDEPLMVNGVPYSVFEGKQYWGLSAHSGQGERIDFTPSDANDAIGLTNNLWLLQKHDKVFMVEISPSITR